MDKLKNWFFTLHITYQAGALVVFSVIIFGLVGPSMISSNSTIAVWFGIAICIAAVYIVGIFSKKIRELFE